MSDQNQWLQLNRKKIEDICRRCTEYEYSGNYGGNLPLGVIVTSLQSALAEIARLQNMVNSFKNMIKEQEKLKTQNESKND